MSEQAKDWQPPQVNEIKGAQIIEFGYWGQDENGSEIISILVEKPSGERYVICPGNRDNLKVNRAEDYYMEAP